MRVIWAFHDVAPGPGENPAYHLGNRGTRSLHLLFHLVTDPGLPDDIITMNFTMHNVSNCISSVAVIAK